jgi:hypothetical protein
MKAVLEQAAGLIFTCQYAELASSLEYHTFPAKVSRHSSTKGNGNTALVVRAFRAVLVRFREYGLKLKPKKCELFQKEVEFLGTVVGPRGMHIAPGYIKDIEDWPRPKNKKEVERFLGFTN